MIAYELMVGIFCGWVIGFTIGYHLGGSDD